MKEKGLTAVQAFREWRGYSLEKLARRSAVSAVRIARHEITEIPLSADEMKAIAKALRIPASSLSS
jgi:hypothetical protein